MLGYFILEGRKPVPCKDLSEWASSISQQESRRVGLTTIDDIEVSTVFMGLDHNYSNSGPPILFETMVFRGLNSGDCYRYRTWEEAEAGHAEVVSMIFKEVCLGLLAEHSPILAGLFPGEKNDD